MSRYGRYDYDDRDYYRPQRRDRDRSEVDIDIRESRSRGPERRSETIVLERDRRDERPARVPEFLREDYGRPTESQQLVIREEVREDDDRSRLSTRRRSIAPERVVKEEEIIIREKERERSRRPPYPPSDIGRGDDVREETVFRERPRSRAPPVNRSKEEIDITIRRKDDDDRSVSSPRGDFRERDVEEVRIRRGEGERRPPRRDVVEEERIEIRESSRESPPRRREEEIDIKIKESERLGPPPGRARSRSRGNVVATEKEEWVVRRPRREPSPPPRDFEKEEIIIRRREREVSPDPPPREPTPEPVVEPIVRPPIIQEVITHYRNIDHGFERAREPSPPPVPSPPREKEEDLEIAIRRSGTRNGRPYDEEVVIERDRKEVEEDRLVRRAPSVAPRRDEEISWKRYNGDRTSKFYADERIYEQDYERRSAIPAPPIGRPEKVTEETRIVTRRTNEEPPVERPRVKDRMWTEVTKDLVIKEAIEETGYEYEETEEFYYVMEYLRYEDVLRLVQLTDDIRRERRERIREIQWEREELERQPKLLPPPSVIAPPPRPLYDERIYEREYIYDRDGRRYRR